jgi:aconitate hydratase
LHLSDRVSVSACLFPFPATRNTYDEILTGLGRPGGGEEFGKFYSLPALSDPRIGEFVVTLRYSILA